MHLFEYFFRPLDRLRPRGMIEDVPSDVFFDLIYEHRIAGWRRVDEYKGPGTWIDYGCVDLRRGFTMLRFDWPWENDGRVYGPLDVLTALAEQRGLRQPS